MYITSIFNVQTCSYNPIRARTHLENMPSFWYVCTKTHARLIKVPNLVFITVYIT